MSDQLTAAVTNYDDQGNVLGYLFDYQFDGGGANLGKGRVYVIAKIITPATDTDPAVMTSASDALVVANQHASALKAAWLSQYDATVEFLTQPALVELGNISL